MLKDSYTYSTQLNWKDDSLGVLRSDDFPELEVASPTDFPYGVPRTWTPEHLFVASVEICLMTTFTAIARNSKVSLSHYSSETTGKMEKMEDNRYMFTRIVIRPVVKVELEKDLERAERILFKAKKMCLISNSIKTEVVVEPEISLT